MLDFGFYNMDCMEGLKDVPDKYFDLAIVDPPYGDAGGACTEQKTARDRGEIIADLPQKVGGGTSGSKQPLRFHGGDRWSKYLDRYKQNTEPENSRTRQQCTETGRNMGLCELAERGRRSTQKNH